MYQTDIDQLKYIEEDDEVGKDVFPDGLFLNAIIESGYPTFRSAIKRRKLSRPMAALIREQHIPVWGSPKPERFATILDYGCGYGNDASRIGCDRYDPWWHPNKPTPPYIYITCTYVLNVIKNDEQRAEVIDKVMSLLSRSGAAFFAVRRDIHKAHPVTARSYWQLPIIMDPPAESIYKCSGFEIYRILSEDYRGKDDSRCSSSL